MGQRSYRIRQSASPRTTRVLARNFTGNIDAVRPTMGRGGSGGSGSSGG